MFGLRHTTVPGGLRGHSALVILFLLLALAGRAALAANPAIDESALLGERPSLDGKPVLVTVGIFVIDVDEIDDVNQRFNIDLFLVARWKDSRLALPEAERRGKTRFVSLDDVWTPRVLILNDRGLKPHLKQGVEIDDLGNVTFQNRMIGELAANLEFQEFPFDSQRLPIDIVSYAYTVEEMQFSLYSNIRSRTEKFSIEGWQLKQLEPEIGVFVVPTDGTELPRITYIIEATRDSDYYVLTMLVPMIADHFYGVDGILAATEYCATAYSYLNCFNILATCAGCEHSPELTQGLLPDQSRYLRAGLYSDGVPCARCCCDRQPLGEF